MSEPVPLRDMIAEVRRELRLRKVVYPSAIARGALTTAAANRQTARLQAVLATLEQIAELDGDPGELAFNARDPAP